MTADAPKTENLIERPPVVVVLGHVDHGKTKILDFIRQTDVVAGEAGGITQHIGAYQIDHPSTSSGQAKKITFIDTPGHEAFSAIRSRGAKVADIAVLVVAADEGVKPQTKEAIQHIQKAEIPFIVALNKIDKENANPAKIKQELAENNVLVEGWGGQVPIVEVSAKTGQGMDALLEMILLVAELEELKVDPNQPAKGVVIESHLDNKRGFVATLLVQEGTLNLNDWVVAGSTYARIKNMEDSRGTSSEKALPSQPVLTLGWSEAPDLGQEFKAVPSKKEAVDETFKTGFLAHTRLLFQSLDELGTSPNGKKCLDVIFKADVLSSLEAIDYGIKNVKSDEVKYRVASYGVGNIRDSDIKSLISNKGIAYGFHVAVEDSAKNLAEKSGVRIKSFNIIYELIEEFKRDLSGLLEPEVKKNVLGRLSVLAVFKSDARGRIVGGKVVSGSLKRGALVDIYRNKALVGSGRLVQLQMVKEDVAEVKEGNEAGIRFEGDFEVKQGDVLEAYEEERIRRSI